MRRTLEEDKYSANGSIVDTDSDDDDHQYIYRGQTVRLERSTIIQAARKHLWLERGGGPSNQAAGSSIGDNDDADSRRGGKRKKKKGKRSKDDDRNNTSSSIHHDADRNSDVNNDGKDKDYERDEGSIFGQTTGSSNSTWVECDKCEKVSFPKLNGWFLFVSHSSLNRVKTNNAKLPWQRISPCSGDASVV